MTERDSSPKTEFQDSENEDVWYQVGYALEQLRRRVPLGGARGEGGLGGLLAALFAGGGEEDSTRNALTGVALSLLPVLLDNIPAAPHRRLHLIRGAAAGAGAALLVKLLGPTLQGEPHLPELDEELVADLLSGAGRGILYAGVIAPRIPGPPLLQGALYGGLEHLLLPMGGPSELLGSDSPHRKVPMLGPLLDPARRPGATLVEDLVFGLALGMFYGSGVDTASEEPGERND